MNTDARERGLCSAEVRYGYSRAQLEEPLTPRTKQVLVMIARGRSTKEIARRLRISVRTVDYHLENARVIMGVRKSWQAALAARKAGYI